jgi:hypothetical protein
LLLDAGENWAGRIGELEPDWIAITYAHPDHAFGRREGTERPVYAMQETCAILARFELRRLRVMIPGVAYRRGFGAEASFPELRRQRIELLPSGKHAPVVAPQLPLADHVHDLGAAKDDACATERLRCGARNVRKLGTPAKNGATIGAPCSNSLELRSRSCQR